MTGAPMDHRRFLGKREEVVAPVVDGAAWLRERAVRCGARPGWYRVAVSGRTAEVIGEATAEEITATLPLVRGPAIAIAGGWGLVLGGKGCERLELVPAGEEPATFAPVRARRWPIGGLLLWEGLDFEGETEEEARRALEEGRGIDDVKGSSAALRAAFVFATARAAGRALGIEAAPVELGRWIGDVAARGRPAVEDALRALARERAEHARREIAAPPATAAREAPELEDRVERAMRATGARALGVRRAGDGLVEVRWSFRGQRFVSLVDERGLRVVDSGVCLAGADDLVTLESLPGVIAEAIDCDALVITRHAT